MAAQPKKSSEFTNRRSDPPVPLIGALLRIPLEEVHRRIIDRLHQRGFDDVGLAHLNVFQYPGPQGKRPSEITAHARVSKQALHYLLNEIERLGYIERRSDPDDARSKRIVLTRRGEAARQVIREAVSEVERDWARQLGERRFATLKALLRELYDAMAPGDRERGARPGSRA
jgi:DNA-binding MarR family transcriptional regulator